ncbi:hypothetical protein [Pseudomonas chlororaphis]|uniref:hypothetical protein n=1 Tax=Pseudomonas chlororaphis TaxID=587753 RepID=UPI0011CE7286|nr:hypothetical protein [Pseudomonas chlororaphis]
MIIERFLVLAVGTEGPSLDQPVELLKIAPGYDIQGFFSGRLAIVLHFFDAGHFRLRFRQNASIQGPCIGH